MKKIAPPIETGLSFSTGTFFDQLWRHKEKAAFALIGSTIQKRAKRMPDIIVKTTLNFVHGSGICFYQAKFYSEFLAIYKINKEEDLTPKKLSFSNVFFTLFVLDLD